MSSTLRATAFGPLAARIDHLWRLFATALSFAAFGAGAFVLSVVVFPPLLLLPEARQRRIARGVIHHAFRAFMALMQGLGVIRWQVEGAERLAGLRGAIVVANHPTLIDVVALIALMPDANCVVKRALWRNPFLFGVVRAAGYVSNDDPERLVQDCARDLAAGTPLVVFPEGTRSVPGEPLRFLRGTSYIVMDHPLPVVPVLIDCRPSTLTKRERWWQIPPRAAVLSLRVLAPRDVPVLAHRDEPRGLTARRLTGELEQFFSRELTHHGFAQT